MQPSIVLWIQQLVSSPLFLSGQRQFLKAALVGCSASIGVDHSALSRRIMLSCGTNVRNLRKIASLAHGR